MFVYKYKHTMETTKQEDNDGSNNLSGNHVDTDITPDVKSNHTVVHICTCLFIWNCFSKENVNS
jgi:hypothetical protein